MLAPEAGTEYGELTFLEESQKTGLYRCRCSCGNYLNLSPTDWGTRKYCGQSCTSRNTVKPGDSFGKLKVLVAGFIRLPNEQEVPCYTRAAFVQCDCGHQQWMIYKILFRSTRCRQCARGRKKRQLPDTQTAFVRKLRAAIRGVTLLVNARDNGQCVWCGSTVRTEVHHGFPLSDYPELCWEPTHMGVLCHVCHRRVHKYGKISAVDETLTQVFLAAVAAAEDWNPTDSRAVDVARENVLVVRKEHTEPH